MPRVRQSDLFSLEVVVIGFIVWLRWGWDSALLTSIGLITLFALLARLGDEMTNWICTLIGAGWGFGAAFVLITAKASIVTCAVFAPMAAIVGFAIHFVAFEHFKASQETGS